MITSMTQLAIRPLDEEIRDSTFFLNWRSGCTGTTQYTQISNYPGVNYVALALVVLTRNSLL